MVVKPARGEQGEGITVGVTSADDLDAALARAREQYPDVLIEQRAPGDDLRLVVIDGEVVAAAMRRPAEVVGTGRHTVRDLIEAQSRRRAAATGGESTHPDRRRDRGDRRGAGWSLDDVLPEGVRLRVRRTANLHRAARSTTSPPRCTPTVRGRGAAAEAIGIPVTGLDLLVPDVTARTTCSSRPTSGPGWPTTSRSRPRAFVDLLFPGSPALLGRGPPRRRPGDRASPSAGAHHDLDSQLGSRLLRVAPGRQLYQPEVAVHVALAGARHRAGGGRADQDGGVHLHWRACSSRTTPVTSATRGWPRSITTSPMKRSSRLAASSHASSPPTRSPPAAPTHTQRVQDVDHRLGGQPPVRRDHDGAQRRGVQALTDGVIGGRA